VRGGRRPADREHRARQPVMAAILLLPTLVGCSSVSSTDYATNAYPSRSLADLLKGSPEPPPPVQTAALPAPSVPSASSNGATTAVDPRSTAAPSGPVTSAAPRAPSANPQESDPAASAYPSVSLGDLLSRQ
jgi:hypothetical protein